jgi:hypothetical protein
MGRPFGPIIAMRQLSGARSRKVTVSLGKPRRMKRGEDWECPFRISGSAVQYGYGVDAIQALTTALEGIRVTLERSGKRLSWVGGNPGDPGFERPVPSALGVDFSRRLNRIIDREVAQFVRVQERRHARRAAKSARA